MIRVIVIESRSVDFIRVKVLQSGFDVSKNGLPVISTRRAVQICMVINTPRDRGCRMYGFAQPLK